MPPWQSKCENRIAALSDISVLVFVWVSVGCRGEHGQDQDRISCRILAILLDQDWIWMCIFEKNWIRTGSGYLFDFYNEIFLRVFPDVTNNGAVVFFAITVFIFTKNQNYFVSMCCTHHNR